LQSESRRVKYEKELKKTAAIAVVKVELVLTIESGESVRNSGKGVIYS